MATTLLEYLAQKNGVSILGPQSGSRRVRAPTISFTLDGRDSSELPLALDKHRIAIRYGHFYAYRAIRDLGLLEQNGVVRVSMVHYNTQAEVDRLIDALEELL